MTCVDHMQDAEVILTVQCVSCDLLGSTDEMQVTKMLTSPPEQLIYRLRSFLFSLSKYSIVATS